MSTGAEMLLERVRAATADEYQIDREIGRGGMAAVFLGRDIALERRVAIKVMLPDLMAVQGVQDRFVIEARTAAHLDHPGIVTVYAVKQRGGLLFIVMKFIDGHTLEGVLRSQGQLDPIAVALIGSRVAEALQFAHGEGVVHRDVKPSNIMIDARGRPVVTDFGIARVLAAQSITVAGSMLGTPTHMSPEQCRGLPATAASDQYSLGVTMYEMLTGRVPFTGSLFELITAHREQAPPRISELAGGIDPALEYTVMRMLAKDPQERWGSMTDVVQRLGAHTTVQQGDASMRATLSVSGAFHATPDRSVAAVDMLTPPGRLPTPATPAGGSPLSPLPLQPPSFVGDGPTADAPGPAAVAVERSPTGHTDGAISAGRGKRGVAIGLGVAGVAAVAAFVAVWGSRSADSAPPTRPDSVPAAAARVPSASTPAVATPATDSLVRDSLVRDSVARVVAAARDSAARDSSAKALAARDSVTADSTARAVAAAAVTARRDSIARAASRARAPQIRPESVAVQCARLLERASLGERLTDAERALLQRRCPK